MNGVSLLSVGSTSYGLWALNFAVSLKANSPEAPIQLLCDEANIDVISSHARLFYRITLIKEDECLDKNGCFCPSKAKLNMYKHFCFDLTAFFDVDACIVKDISSLFRLQGDLYADVQGIYKLGMGDYFPQFHWVLPNIMWSHFGLKNDDILPAVNSSFMLVRKSKKNEELFSLAASLYADNLLPLQDYSRRWGTGEGHQADEVYYNAAYAKQGIIPCHLPAIYFRLNSNKGRVPSLNEVRSRFFAIGLYGDSYNLHLSVKNYYNMLMKTYWSSVIGTSPKATCEDLLKEKFVVQDS